MNRISFSLALLAAAYTSEVAVAQDLGKACTDPLLTQLFNNINDARQNTVNSNSYKDYLHMKFKNGEKGATTQAYQRTQLTLRQGSIYEAPVQYDGTSSENIDAGIRNIQDAPDNLPALEWDEGLAKAADDYVKAWKDAMLIKPKTTRAEAHGAFEIGGQALEGIYTYSAYVLDPIDFTRQVLTNHSDSQTPLSTTLFTNNEYTKIGVAYTTGYACYMKVPDDNHDPPTSMHKCPVKLVVMLGKGYSKNDSVAECSPSVNYGAELCQPNKLTKDVYQQVLNMR